MNKILEQLGDYEILERFETALREKSLENNVGYFTGTADRDPDGSYKIMLRVAAMVDTAGEEEFDKNEALRQIVVPFPEGDVVFEVKETVPVSGLEMEVVYYPLG